MKKQLLLVACVIITFQSFIFAQANAAVPSTIITEGFSDHFGTVWGVVLWVSRAILMIVATIVGVKNALGGNSHDKTGGWITVIAILLVAIGIGFVPTISNTLFGISF